ncbi:MAG TPA: hypothetical protein VKU94_00595 [Geobacterales bacterium]|nr:hypothetical protein [Geobacterales bacterium]
MLFSYFTKSLLRIKALWGWGVLFMVFYLVLGALVFGNELPKNLPVYAYVSYTSSWYALINLYTLSSLAISISNSIMFATYSLSYCFRFTRLKPMSYLLNFVLSSIIVGLTMSSAIMISTYGLFSYQFNMNLAPANLLFIAGTLVLSSIFMFAFSTLLVLLLINYLGLRNQSFISFIPLLLGFGFGFGQLYLSLPTLLLYASPFTAAIGLLYHGYSGLSVPVTLAIGLDNGSLDVNYLIISLASWAAILLLIDSYFLSRIKPRMIEEMRQI